VVPVLGKSKLARLGDCSGELVHGMVMGASTGTRDLGRKGLVVLVYA
jgi:hypothetical protein